MPLLNFLSFKKNAVKHTKTDSNEMVPSLLFSFKPATHNQFQLQNTWADQFFGTSDHYVVS